jgi:hypothetical protein
MDPHLPNPSNPHGPVHTTGQNSQWLCIRRDLQRDVRLTARRTIANNRLVHHLQAHGNEQAEHIHGIFRNKDRPVLLFSLVVDNFGVQYTKLADAKQLKATLKAMYEITINWTGTKYLGLALKWDYQERTCNISMPGYIERMLQHFAITPPTVAQHSPHAWQNPIYGATTQLTPPIDESKRLTPPKQKDLQKIIGVLLHYARAIDSTLLVVLGTLAVAQSKGTKATVKACTQLLNYCATHPDAVVQFIASNMVLHTDSNASYFSEPQSRSRVGGIHHLSSTPIDP